VALFPKNLVECSYAEAECLAGEVCRILKPGGCFIITLPDSLMKYAAQNKPLLDFDLQTGCFTAKTAIPGQGEYDYPTYFWTCPFAVYIFGRHFQLSRMEQIGNTLYMMVFTKG
jgi:hypothetical protein